MEAYRTLRDPEKRAVYDRERTIAEQRAAFGHAGGEAYSKDWPFRGDKFHTDARGNIHNRGGQHGASASEGAYTATPNNMHAEGVIVGTVVIGGVFFYFNTNRDVQDMRDQYPSRQPSSQSRGMVPNGVAGGVIAGHTGGGGGISASSSLGTASSGKASAGVAQDDTVQAFYNPFSRLWHRLPEGYEPPGAMDLTAWHKKRTDPVEWSRLFAEGKLSDMIPRGGLQVRWRPAWDTHEPVIVKDPHTGRTVMVTDMLPSRSAQATACEVEF